MIGSNPLNNYIASSKFLLDIAEPGVYMFRPSVGGALRAVRNINRRLVILVDSNRPDVRVIQLFK